MPLAEPTEHTEQDTVEAWRLQTLLQAGYAHHRAELIAASDADLHQAVKLIRHGCPQHIALHILV